jgi:hypothetical protein
MHFQLTSLLACAVTSVLLVSAAPTNSPASTAPAVEVHRIEDLPNTNLTKRTTSCTGNYAILTSDAQAIQNYYSSLGTANTINVPPFSSQTYNWNSAQVCVQNNYLAEHTHTSGFEIAFGIGQIIERCSGGNPGYTAISWQNINGDSGLGLIVNLQTAGAVCAPGLDGASETGQ